MKTTSIQKFSRQLLILGLSGGLTGWVNAANMADIAKVAPGNTIVSGTGKQWPADRFTVDSTGNCMLDNLTGLMWSKDANLFGRKILADAKSAVAAMNGNDTKVQGYHLCGHTDWRLPNINELTSLINYGASQDDSTPNNWLGTQGFGNVQSGKYWSTTLYDNGNGWFVDFADGLNNYSNIANYNYVWPVRGGQ